MAQEPLIIVFSSYMILALMLSLQVYLGLRIVLFGIVLPEEAMNDTAVRVIRRNYVLLSGSLAVIIGAACLLWLRHQPARVLLIWMTSLLLLTVASLIVVWLSRTSVQRLKAARDWKVVQQTKRVASLAPGQVHDPLLSPWWYLVNTAVMALCTLSAIARWDTIPYVLYLGMIPFYKTGWTVFMLNLPRFRLEDQFG